MRRLLALLPPLLSACAVAVPLGGGAAGQAAPAAPAVAPADLMFPECQGVELAFQGETTLGALGLDEFAGGPEASKVALIWVTADPVAMDMGPVPVGKGGDLPPAQRVVCVQWPDGSGMMGPVDNAWQPPSLLDGGDGAALAAEDGAPPLGLVALVVGAAVLVGVSVFAFRREGA